jgi:endonuclease III
MDMKTIQTVYRIVKAEYSRHKAPVVDFVAVQTRDPLKVLVTTILSARTKDETTTVASVRLFKRIANLEDLRRIPLPELEQLIFPVGFYRTKAIHLKELPDALDTKFGGKIPSTVEELCELPGVGRKTANLVVALAFDKPAVCVDVHVHRISNRLGILKTRTPHETEMALRKLLPVRYWKTWNSYFVSFGQTTCAPVSPRCSICPIAKFCPCIGVTSSR